MRWVGALSALAVVVVVVSVTWVSGCDENPDCGGVSLAAYYALVPLVLMWLALVVVALVWRARRRR